MNARAYYNEIDPAAVAVLRELIVRDVIMPGDVDDRSIADVSASDVRGYTQCHFFAGGGLWSVAARLAGWPDERQLWTGSCPCQPFSAAGKQLGTDDPRHLWPHFHRLIRECRPPVVFGEQVSNAAGTRRDIDAHMREMWRREAVLGLLSDARQARQFEWLSCAMQGLLQGEAGGLSDWFEAASVGFISQIPREQSGQSAGQRSAVAGEAGQHSVRSGRIYSGIAEENRPGDLRADRLALERQGRSDVGQPVTGSDRACAGVHDRQRARDPFCRQCDDEHMGPGPHPDHRGRDQGAASAGRGASALPVGTEAERAPSLDWLDGIVFDLDASDYATRFSDIPACAVDAPHQRNRLYWTAVDNRVGTRLEGQCRNGRGSHGRPHQAGSVATTDGELLTDTDVSELQGQPSTRQQPVPQSHARQLRNSSWWSDHEWIVSPIDGKARRTKPRVPDVAHGIPRGCDQGNLALSYDFLVPSFPGRVAAWRLTGNAIVPWLAAEVIAAFLDIEL